MRNWHALVVAAAGLLAWSGASPSSARLVDIQYYDRAGPAFPGSGGPLWTGVVNTVSDTLTVQTWTELPGHGDEWWSPADLPMTWNALDASGNRYDVPNSFGDDGIVSFGNDQDPTNDFAFISPISSQNMNWHPFDDNLGQVDTSQTVSFTATQVIFIGWGGVATQNSTTGEISYFVAQPNSTSDTAYDYRVVPLLPVSATTVQTSTDATITVLPPTGSTVPEASAFLAVGLAGAACAAVRRLRQAR